MRAILSRASGAIIGILLCCSAIAQTPNVTIQVTGAGSTLDEARTEAVRQALQRALRQLVVVDRAIAGDAILRDKVMSTMNGYVDKFKELGIQRSGSGYEVNAEVTISASRIENFIGVTAAGGGAFSGPLLSNEQGRILAQKDAEKLQARARGEILGRLLMNHPTQTYDIQLLKIDLSPDNPNTYILEMQASLKPTFIRSLAETVSALSEYECRPKPVSAMESFWVDWLRQMRTRYNCLDLRNMALHEERDTVCIAYSEAIRCFALTPGDYCKNGGECPTRQIKILGRFIDASGQSAMKARCTVGVPEYAANQGGPWLEAGYSGTPVALAFAAGSKRFKLKIEDDEKLVDFRRAAHFVAIASASPERDCNLLDEAVQHYMRSKR